MGEADPESESTASVNPNLESSELKPNSNLLEDWDPAVARAEAERQKHERLQATAQDEARLAEEVEQVHQLLNKRARAVEPLGAHPEQARQIAEREAGETDRIEALERQQRALQEGLRASDINERIQALTDRLGYLETELVKTQDELSATQDKGYRADLQTVVQQTEVVLAMQRRALEGLQEEFAAWQSELMTVANPILEALGRAGETVDRPEQLEPLFTQLGEQILARNDLMARSAKLLGKIAEIEAPLIKLLEKPSIQRELHGLYRRERDIRADLTQLVAPFVSKVLYTGQEFAETGVTHVRTYETKLRLEEQRDADAQPPELLEARRTLREKLETSPPAAQLVEQLTDDFIDGLADRYGLNDAEMTAETRVRHLAELTRIVRYVLMQPGQYDRAIRDAASASPQPDVGERFAQRYHSQDRQEQLRARVEIDAMAFAYLMFHGDYGVPDPKRAWDMFEFEERIAHRRSNLPQSTARQIAMRERSDAFIRERFQPYGVMLERMKAAQDAEVTALRAADVPGKKDGTRFFGSHFGRALEAATASNRSEDNRWVPAWGTGQPMLTFELDPPNDSLTPEQQQEKDRLVAAYNETYLQLSAEIPRYIERLQGDARRLVAEIEPLLLNLKEQQDRSEQEYALAAANAKALIDYLVDEKELPVSLHNFRYRIESARALRRQLSETGFLSFKRQKQLRHEIEAFESAVAEDVTKLQLVRRQLHALEQPTPPFPGFKAVSSEIGDWYGALSNGVEFALAGVEKRRTDLGRRVFEAETEVAQTTTRLGEAKQSVWYTSAVANERVERA